MVQVSNIPEHRHVFTGSFDLIFDPGKNRLSMADNEEKKFKVKVNEFEFEFTRHEAEGADIISSGASSFNIIRDAQSLNVLIREEDLYAKQQELEANGEVYKVVIKDPLDQVLDTMGFNNVSAKLIREITAPMPGLVLDVSVSEGDELQEGDRVLILEAMKMENSIVMHSNGKISQVLVKKGQAVEKGQILVVIGQ